jgi:5'-3' exonuclease
MKYIIVDLANTYFRAKHVASRNSNAWEKVGMALHLSLASINQVARKFGADHIIVALEGRSWRKDFYKPYKANRALDETVMTEAEIEENKLFWETYEAFTTFLREKTNVSVIRHPQAEADDIIARFIHLHPNDEHFIISSDTDFYQLITENVKQYNGITNQLITVDGYFDDRDRPVIDKKTKQHKTLGDPKFILFEKCMRGDATDNVFSAYPGVRTKGSKNKVGLMEAYADRERKGFNFNNLMLQKWIDHNGVEHRVKDDYERNRILIDLTAQPDDIRQAVDDTIRQTVKLDHVPQVGVHLMKFTGKYDLKKISDQAETYAKWLNSEYKGVLHDKSIL